MTHSFVPVVPGNLIHAQDLNQVINALDGLAAAGVPIVLTALSDPSNFALVVQNQESSNSRALLVLKSDGTQLVRVDVNGVTLGAPLNLALQSINGNALENGTVPNAALGPDVARANLLTNGGFEIWQRGNGPFVNGAGVLTADRWEAGTVGSDSLSISADTTNTDGPGTAMAVTYTMGSGGSFVYQPLVPGDGGLTNLRGLTVSASMRVRTATPNAVRLGGYNGSTWAYSAYHPGDGTYHTLTYTWTIQASATSFHLGVFFSASCTAYIDNATLVVGSQPANYVPLHPADDLARCYRYYEQPLGQPNTVALFYLYGAASSQAGTAVTFHATKPVAPTVTKVGTWTVSNCGQPSVLGSNTDSATLIVDITALGLVAYGINATGAGLTVEANP